MKKIQIILATWLALGLLTFALAGVTPTRAQAVTTNLNDPAELDAFMDGFMTAEMNAAHIPGAVVVVVKDGQVFFSKGYGYADLDTRDPVNPAKTLFRPGSVSKLFTWTAIMQLAEQGKLSLDEDINTYLDFSIPATFPEPITIKHLLTHTPGFEDVSNGLFKINPENMVSLETYLKQYLPQRVYPPGKIGAYSNYGTALAGYIVERVVGQPFYEYAEEHIFAPLGMTHATFRQPLPPEFAADMSGGYNYANGEYLQGGFEYISAYPAGALSISGLDIARFMIAHLQNGRFGETQILSEQTVRQMHSQLFTHDPRLTGMAYGFFESEINEQGVLSHGGATILFHTGLYLFPEQNVGLFVSTNGTNGGKLVYEATHAFVNRYFPTEHAPALTFTADFAARAQKYAGEYYSSRSNFTTMEKIVRLTKPIIISVNEQSNVVVSVSGQRNQYVEVEPGLLVNIKHPEERLVLREENGQVSLYTSQPFVYVKTPWYASMAWNGFVLIGGLLLFLGTITGWGISFIRGVIRHEQQPLPARLARLAGGMFGLVYLSFMVLFLALFADYNPAYGVPNFFFEIPAWIDVVMRLPQWMGLLGLAMILCTLLAWWKRFWTIGGRLFYTLLTLSALSILATLIYWNLLL